MMTTVMSEQRTQSGFGGVQRGRWGVGMGKLEVKEVKQKTIRYMKKDEDSDM